MPEQLKPCPACGSVNCRLIEREMSAYVVCDFKGCWMSGPIKEYADSAIAAWNQLPRALTWTTEPPKVAGWYFQRTLGEDKTINVAYVYSGLSGLYCKCGCRNTTLKCWIGFEWAGPIPEPLEQEES